MRRILLLMALTLPSLAVAQEPTIVLYPDGTAGYWDGKTTVHVTRIIPPPGEYKPPTGGPTDPPPPPPPGNESGLYGWAVQASSAIGDAVGAAIMEAMYDTLADQIKLGRIPSDATSVDSAMVAASSATWDMMPGSAKVDSWKEFHREAAKKLGEFVVKSGGPNAVNRDQWNKAFTDIANGVGKPYEGAAIPEWLEPIIKALIQELIKIILKEFS